MGQMNFRKPSFPNSASHQQPNQPLPASNTSSTLHNNITNVGASNNVSKRVPQNSVPPKSHQPSSSSLNSQSYNGKNNAIEKNRMQDQRFGPSISNSSTEKAPNKISKEFEEQANMANANEVSTEDIVVPPPESFGNDDNHRALAAAAVVQVRVELDRLSWSLGQSI